MFAAPPPPRVLFPPTAETLVEFNETPPDDDSEMLAAPPVPEPTLPPLALKVALPSDMPPPVALSVTDPSPNDAAFTVTPFSTVIPPLVALS
jgi:hypothetical protein